MTVIIQDLNKTILILTGKSDTCLHNEAYYRNSSQLKMTLHRRACMPAVAAVVQRVHMIYGSSRFLVGFVLLDL